MTDKEFLKNKAKHCADVEIYKYIDNNERLHSDYIKFLNVGIDALPEDLSYPEDYDFFELDEEEYKHTVEANCGDYYSFSDLYRDDNPIVLVIILRKNFFERYSNYFD